MLMPGKYFENILGFSIRKMFLRVISRPHFFSETKIQAPEYSASSDDVLLLSVGLAPFTAIYIHIHIYIF